MMRKLMILGAMFWFCSCSNVRADFINPIQRGWYESSGATETNFLIDGVPNNNYIAGRACNFDDDGNLLGHFEFNNFFVFDLTGRIEPVTSATLRLLIPVDDSDGTDRFGFGTIGESEVYTLFDVNTPQSVFQNSETSVAAFNDLGSGINYGSVNITLQTMPTFFSIQLNAAGLAALNANLGGTFILGGAITGINRNQEFDQLAFAFTHTPTGVNDGNSQLELVTASAVIPAPPAVFLLAAAVPIFAVVRARRRR